MAGIVGIRILARLIGAARLVLTLAGLFLTLKHDPPEVDFWEESVKRSLISAAEIRIAAENVARNEKIKIELSKTGVRLLLFGKAFQFIGTNWQVLRLACGG